MTSPERFIVGAVEDFPPGSRTILDVGGKSIGLYNVAGKYFAVHNMCPHALAPIAMSDVTGTFLPSRPGEFVYGLEGRVLRCIWHGWEFNIETGEALFGTDRRHLATFPVLLEGNEVTVTLRPRSSS